MLVNGAIDYTITPTPNVTTQLENNLIEYEFLIDLAVSSKITINVISQTPNSTIQVKRLVVSGIEVGNINNISIFKTLDGRIKKTHGYLDEPGTFTLKIHTNPISLNYLSYLLDLTKK